MDNNDAALLLVKIAMLEGLVKHLYAESLQGRADPVAAASSLGEAFAKGISSHSDQSDPIALLHSEQVNLFFDDLVAELRRRAEIRAQTRKPDSGA